MKWRFFRHLIGGDDHDSVRVYLWHIRTRRASGFVDGEKPTLDIFVPAAKALFGSMREAGFHEACAIPVDPRGDILGGAHRLACAIALGCDLFIEDRPEKAWAPAWGRDWFVEHGMGHNDLVHVGRDWEAMCRSA